MSTPQKIVSKQPSSNGVDVTKNDVSKIDVTKIDETNEQAALVEGTTKKKKKKKVVQLAFIPRDGPL